MRKALPLARVIKLAYIFPMSALLVAFVGLACLFAFNQSVEKSESRAESVAVTASLLAGYPVVTYDAEALKHRLNQYVELGAGELIKIENATGDVFYKSGSPGLGSSAITISRFLNFFGSDSKVTVQKPIYLHREDSGSGNNFSDVQQAGNGLRVGTVYVDKEIAPQFQSALMPRLVAVALLLLGVVFSYFYIRSIGKKIAYAVGLLVKKSEMLQRRDYDAAHVWENTPAVLEVISLIDHHNHVVSELKTYDLSMQDNVKKATAHIQSQNRALEETSAKLMATNQEKTEFMNAVSHDLRNPLGTIKLSSEMLMNMVENRDATVLSQQILASAKSMISVIEDIMDVNQMENDWVSIHRTETDVISLIDQVVNQYQQTAQTKGIDLFWKPSVDFVATMMIDERVVGRIISNLVGNSVKNTSHGYVTLYARTEEDERSQDRLILEVTDGGSWFSGVQAQNLFDSELGPDSIEADSGIGLSLSIVKQMVTALGGDIKVICKEGLGTSFIVSIPVDLIARYSVTQNEIRQQFSELSVSVGVLDDGSPFASSLSAFLDLHNVASRTLNKRDLMSNPEVLSGVGLLIGHKLSVAPAAVSLIKDRGVEIISMESLQDGEQLYTLQKTMRIDHPVMIHSSFFSVIRLVSTIEQQRSVAKIGGGTQHLARAAVNPLGDILAAQMKGPLFGIRVLVVEDSQNFGTVLKSLIESNDGECILATGLEDMPGNDLLKQCDLAFIDYEANGGRGTQCAKSIRDALGDNAPKLVCITSHVVRPNAPEFIAMDRLVDLTISKPLPASDEIIDLMLRLLR